MKKTNNKGAALISVMIAITFLAIISTTLLLITLDNYQMKVINSQSKSNFYETEQRVNVVTAQIRDGIKGQTDVNSYVGNLVNGGTGVNYSGASFPYKGSKIAELAFPGKTVGSEGGLAYVQDGDDRFYFSDGTVNVTTMTNGKKITIDNLTIKQVSNKTTGTDEGEYESTIKTDVNYFVEIANSAGGGGGVGSCAFLLDSTIRIDGTDKLARLNISGNTIMGDYTYLGSGSYATSFLNGVELSTPQELTEFSVPTGLDKTKTGDTVSYITAEEANYKKAIIYLNNLSIMNFNSDNNVILGDIYLKDSSVLNILGDGNFTVYGDIFVADKATFLCNGSLKLGNNCNIYRVDSEGNCVKVTAADKDNRILFSSITRLDKKNYDKLADHLKLFDNDAQNDGVINNIIKQAGAHNKYFYEAKDAYQTKSGVLCTFNGIDYYAEYPAGDLNNSYKNELLLINDKVNNPNVYVTQNVPNSTIISRKPVYAYDTHSICVSRMGDQAFNYILSNSDCKIKFEGDETNDEETISIKDFFDPNCNTFVSTVFSISTGNGGTTPTPTKTRISYSDWIKE